MTPLDPLPPDDDPFALLGVDPTDPDLDARALKRAYTRLIKRYKPERDPVAFRRIRQAYESALDRLGLNVVPGLPPVVVNSLRSQRPPDGGLPSREPGPRPFAHPARAADELRAELLEQVDAGRFDAAFERAAAEAAKWKRAGWIAVHDVCLQLAAALAWQAPTGADRLFERLETWVGVAPEAAGRIEDYRERRRLRPAWTRSRTRVATTPALDRLLQLAPLLGTDALRRARDDARAEAAGAPARTLAALDALHRAQPALLGQLHESIARALPPRRPCLPTIGANSPPDSGGSTERSCCRKPGSHASPSRPSSPSSAWLEPLRGRAA